MTAAAPAASAPRDLRDYPPGLIAVPCSDIARYHLFTNALMQLELPPGTRVAMHMSTSVVDNLNHIIEEMPGESEWLWVIGDDHTFPPDTVTRLLDWDVDIVAPLCTRRAAPFGLVAFDEEGDLDEHGRRLYHILQFDDLPAEPGLMPIHASGSAGMLIRRDVLDTLGYPWFSNSDGNSTNEDVEFCRKAREAGFQPYLDTTFGIGHIGVVTIVPGRIDGRSGVSLNFQGGKGNSAIFIPGGIRPDDSGTPDVRTGVWGK